MRCGRGARTRGRAGGPEHGSLGARVRAARLVPYQAVIGAREAAADRGALRLRGGRRLGPLPAADVLARVRGLVASHGPDLWDAEAGRSLSEGCPRRAPLGQVLPGRGRPVP
ncbi:hypothetical protein GCM10010358_66380 [Streptomyces minutiscleroticus]|uniref:Anticodon-binding domain-containing protein n=1 Tax=Streptomyces minutiscleroticus TaxID=68238 RepID=A0A918NWW2_9ACTN|nr:hypothetical protein GCM10010358_66380 [Streptomyces minutiscleroticus]